MNLVTLDDAYAHLRIDYDAAGSAEDGWLELAIAGVSGAVAAWLKDSWRLYTPELDSAGGVVKDSAGNPIPAEDSSGTPIVHPVVRLAVLVELAAQYRFREGDGETGTPTGDLYSGRYGYILGRAATAVLSGMRRSTVA